MLSTLLLLLSLQQVVEPATEVTHPKYEHEYAQDEESVALCVKMVIKKHGFWVVSDEKRETGQRWIWVKCGWGWRHRLGFLLKDDGEGNTHVTYMPPDCFEHDIRPQKVHDELATCLEGENAD